MPPKPPQKASTASANKRYRTYDEFERDVFPRVHRERQKTVREAPGRTMGAEILKGVKKHLSS